MTATLHPPVPTTVDLVPLDSPPSEIERYLTAAVHNQVRYHLLDPDRPLEPMGKLPEAVVAVGALDPKHPLAEAILAVDDALAGQSPGAAIPDALAAALRVDRRRASWLGVRYVTTPIAKEPIPWRWVRWTLYGRLHAQLVALETLRDEGGESRAGTRFDGRERHTPSVA
ncbi:MAG: hypothetical protein M3137_13265 [Actinomycetota bacterium]|nr:hypothetical protein [Actinomycetota bacterium]